HLRETKIFTQENQWAVVQRMTGNEQVGNPDHKYTNIGHASTRSPSLLNAALLDIDQGQNNNTIQLNPNSITSLWASDPATKWLFESLRKYMFNAFFFDHYRHSTARLPNVGIMTLNQDGSNLAQVLHTINSNDRRKFQEIERFVHAALPDIGQLQAPVPIGTQDTEIAFVSPEGYTIRLHEMGGGIEQLLMVATVLLTTTDEHPVFLEEPENHLHAGAQRFLLEKLYDGERQVSITTHSSVYINLSRPFSLYQVTYSNGRTAIKRCDASSLESVLEDIGVRNSDVLLSDAVLFVEGTGDKEAFSMFSEKLGMSLAERNINVLPMGGGKYVERGAPIRSGLLTDISQRAPIKHMFILDKDERRQEEINNLKDRLGDKIYFLQRRELENYLLVPRAILSALRTKQRDSAATVDALASITEEQINQLIDEAANSLYKTVFIKRIRAEIGGLREGLLPSEALSSLTVDTGRETSSELVLQAIKSQWEHYLAGLNIDNIVSSEKAELDAEWADPAKRLLLAPGEEILIAVFTTYGFEYSKPIDTVRIAREIPSDEIDEEIISILRKACDFTTS
ncbi:MAG TPA: AAA family ATPase, partial [Methylomirabilota bacterium]|nr:AAA family ATPase [Methylomirabilota bacterium]